MPRKQRFKPSRKPKPQVVEGFPSEQITQTNSDGIDTSQQTARNPHSDFGPIEPEERPK
jgi:hypothetical protein